MQRSMGVARRYGRSLQLLLGSAAAAVLVLNLGAGCDVAWVAPPLIASGHFDFQQESGGQHGLNGVILPPNLSGVGTDVIAVVGGASARTEISVQPSTVGTYGGGTYGGTHGQDYYFSDAYYQGGLY